VDKAKQVLAAIDQSATTLGASSTGLERGFAALGFMLLEASSMHYWDAYYETFREFLSDVSLRCGRSIDQLQRYFLTVRDLSDSFSREEMETMGITKAMKVRQVLDYPSGLPAKVRESALDPAVTVKDLKRVIHENVKFPEEPHEGEWVDYEAEGYVSADRKATLDLAIYAAMHTEPIISTKNSKGAQMLEVLERFAQEYIAGHPEALPEAQ
jgi:hypothetical protein